MVNRLEQLEKLLESTPNDPFLNYAKALEFSKLGFKIQAVELFHWLITHHSNYIGTYYQLAKLLEELGNREEALNIYSNGIKKAKELKEFHALSELQSAYTNLMYDE